MNLSLRFWVFPALVAVTLAGCKGSEERAQEYFDNGSKLIAEGEVAKGLVELRNVFELDPNHAEARRLFAETLLADGKYREALGQYTKLIEQHPDDVEGLIAASELSFKVRDFDAFRRHVQNAVERAPEDSRVAAYALAVEFMDRVKDDRKADTSDLTPKVMTALEALPDNPVLSRMAVDLLARDGKMGSALEYIDRALVNDPDNYELNQLRLAILSELQDNDKIEAQLVDMVDRYPNNDQIKTNLVQFLVSRNQPERAEKFLRSFADPAADPPSHFLALTSFLNQTKGVGAALDELNSAIDANPDVPRLKAMRADLNFAIGRRDEAIAELETLTATGAATDETRRFKALLAQMLQRTGNEVGARKLVEEVLTDDPSQSDALRMQAAWQIAADDTDGAIASLRTALDNDANDAAALTLMAQAHSRAGSPQLAQDFLGLAVEASGQRPEESIRYAATLIEDKSYLAAEDILMAALRRAPNNTSLLSQLGRLYILKDDDSRLNQLIDTLRRMEGDEPERLANQLTAAHLERTEGRVASSQFLEQLAQDSGNEMAAVAAVARTRLLEGKPDAALSHVQDSLAADPDNMGLRHLLGVTRMAVSDFAGAEGDFRALIEAFPEQPQFRMDLVRALHAQGKFDVAATEIDAALELIPGNPNLMWAKGTLLQRDGDISGAIDVYREVYANNSDSVVIANNLASLLADYRDDPEALDQAWSVARRLRGIEVPAFQDTYGWIAFRRGDLDDALDHLRPAAAGLPNDALVQYHLARALIAKNMNPAALQQLEKVKQVSELDPGRVDMAEVDEAIASVRAKMGASQ